MRRREFLGVLGGAAARGRSRRARSRPTRAARRRADARHAADDPDSQARIAAFLQGLQEAGWDGRPQPADRDALERRRSRAPAQVRGGTGRARRRTSSWPAAARPCRPCCRQPAPCRSCSRRSIDPVGAGFVKSLARPGGNATGFIQFEYGLSGKWLELLKEIAPEVKRVGVLRDPATGAGIGQWAVIQAVAPSLGVELSPIDVRDAAEIERAHRRRSRASRTAA